MAKNRFSLELGRAYGSAVVPSGDVVIGDVSEDKDGNVYRLVLATDEAISDGRVVEFKAGECPSGVVMTNAASGTIFAGVPVLNKDADTSAATGEVFYAQIGGVARAHVNIGAGAGEFLIPTASGTLAGHDGVVDTEDFPVAQAIEAGGGNGGLVRVILL